MVLAVYHNEALLLLLLLCCQGCMFLRCHLLAAPEGFFLHQTSQGLLLAGCGARKPRKRQRIIYQPLREELGVQEVGQEVLPYLPELLLVAAEVVH